MFGRRPLSVMPSGTKLWQVQSCLISHRSFVEASGNKSSMRDTKKHGNERRDEKQEDAESMNFYRTDINEQCQVLWRYYSDALLSWSILFGMSKMLAKLVALLTCTLGYYCCDSGPGSGLS